jgi:hypothetical protein
VKTYFKDLAENMDYKFQRYSDNFPQILTTTPIINGATDVDPLLKQITIVFNMPMKEGYSFNWTEVGKEYYPIDGVIGWDKTNTQFTVRLKLNPNRNYEMSIMKQRFLREDGSFSLPEDVLFRFKTR